MTTTTTLARTIDLLALAYALGSTVWFFFVQSPVLLKRMGRDRFVPLQMSMAPVLFLSLSVALLVMTGAALVSTHAATSTLVLTALVALVGAVVNSAFVVPRALKTGGRSLKEGQTLEEQKSLGSFASKGAGQASQFWHRAVVVFVLVMVGGLLPHAVALASVEEAAGHAHGAGTAGAPAAKWRANAETTEGVNTMLTLARQAAQRTDATSADVDATVRQLDEAYQNIFLRCTMTGAAHEALHEFLLPVGAMLKDLAGSEGPAAAETFQHLENHLDRYARSFE